MAYLTSDQLKDIGFKKLGLNVKISDKVSFYCPANISIGNNVRIDDYTILSACNGYIDINNHIHISTFCNLIGKGGIVINDFCGLSSRVSLYSVSDDYSGDYLIGPVMNKECVNLISGPILLQKFVTIGTNSTVLPNVNLKEGSVLGAHSLLKKDTEEWTIYSGVAAKKREMRKKGLLNLIHLMDDKHNC
jgi:acetyltransferase-like isoleucine patch superfamily enzyme